jgi:sulfide:quinone oxidoreductase
MGAPAQTPADFEMNIKELTPEIFVSPQISPDDVAQLADQGFKSIVSNRPDGESADQPDFAVIEAAAKAHGLEIRYLPIVSGRMTENDVAAFKQALDELPGPVLAYCRSGTRCAAAWALAEAGERPVEDILATTAKAGYDMSGLAPMIASRSSG